MATNDTFKVRDRRGGNRFFIDNIFYRGGWAAALGPYGIAAYNALALHADATDQDAFPSYSKIAVLTGMSERQAIRKIAELEDCGIITRDPKFDEHGRQTSNDYLLLHASEWKPVGVTVSHTGGDCESYGGVTVSHTGGDCESPKQDSVKQDSEKQTDSSKKLDPVEHMLSSLGAASEKTGSYPKDQFFFYREPFLDIYQQRFGSKFLNETEKAVVAKLGSQPDSDPTRWDQACEETILNWTGRGRPSLQRVVDVYKAGGTWAGWVTATFNDDDQTGRNGSTPASHGRATYANDEYGGIFA